METNFIWFLRHDVDLRHQDALCAIALEAAARLADQDWANRSIENSGPGSVESAVPASLLIESAVRFHALHVEVQDR